MFTKYKNNPIIIPNSKLYYEKECTYNPCAIVKDNKVFLIYRAEGKKRDYISKLCLAISTDGFNFKKYKNNPIIVPDRPEEKRGCEDPRITKIGDTYYLTYTAYKGYENGKNKIGLSLATSDNLINWKKKGIILDNMKAGYIYPEKINEHYIMFVGVGNIRIARSRDLVKWTLDEESFLSPRSNYFDNKLVEVGPPFIFLDNKIVMIYNSSSKKGRYAPSYVILDRNNPTRILYRHNEPLLIPTKRFELFGNVDNVIFAEGLVKFNKKYFLYYGTSDKYTGVATVDEKEVK